MHTTPPATTAHDDRQDLVNHLLAAALHARATLEQTRRAAELTAPGHPHASADLADTATALGRIRHTLLHAADTRTGPDAHGLR